MRDVLRFARLAHAVTLDGFGENHRRLLLVFHRRCVSGVNFVRIVAAAIQAPDIIVGHAGDHFQELGIFAEEIFANVGAVLGAVGLILAVHAFIHELLQKPLGVPGQQRVPVRTPYQLDYVPAGAAEIRFQFLDDFAVAAHRAVEALQIAVHHENQVIELLARGDADGAHGFRLVHFAIADKAPDFASFGGGNAAIMQVFHEARLIDRHQRAKSHRYGGKLPEVGHQPWMGIGGQALAAHFLAEMVELFLGEPSQHEGAGINARRRVALHVDQVAAVFFRRRVPEVIVADVIQCGGGSEGRDMAADVGVLVGAQHHGQRVPTRIGTDAVLDCVIARRVFFLRRRNGVDVGGVGAEGQISARASRFVNQSFQQVMGAVGALLLQNGFQRIQPFLRFLGIVVGESVHGGHLGSRFIRHFLTCGENIFFFYYNTCYRVFSAYIACGITNGLPQLDMINTTFVSISC